MSQTLSPFKSLVKMVENLPSVSSPLKFSQTSMVRTSVGPWKFEIWVVQATEDQSWCQVRKQTVIIQGNLTALLQNNGMLCVLIRIASMRQF